MSSFSYIDIHSHVNFAAFDSDRDEVIKRAQEAGVAMINIGTQKDTSQKAIELAEKYERGVYAIVGLHPIHTGKSFHDAQEIGPAFASATTGKEGKQGFTSRGEIFDTVVYRKMAAHPKVVAIGECGLDYYRNMEHGIWNMEQKRQEEVFRKQIELAIEVKKPLMFHLRNGSNRSVYQDAFNILKSYILNHKSGSSLQGNLHFFAGSIEEAKPFLDMGFSFSFTGVITFTHDYDEVIRYLPSDRILSETDAPYVAPEPYRGKRNEPLYVREVVKRLAAIRSVPLLEMQENILQNAARLFGLPLSQ